MQEKSFSCYFQKENKLRFIKKSFFITKKGLSLKCRKKPTTKKNKMRNTELGQIWEKTTTIHLLLLNEGLRGLARKNKVTKQRIAFISELLTERGVFH